MTRIGLFGGTFDPPHVGHLILAGEALDSLKLDKILWILTPQSPLKDGRAISSLEQRIELLEATLKDIPGFDLSLVDVNRKPPYYALDTISLLRDEYPGTSMVYIMGGDSLKSLPSWYQSVQLVQEIDGLGVYRRPGSDHDLDQLNAVIPDLKDKVTYFSAPQVEISSADIRQRIRDGRMFRHFLPPDVYRIIQSREYYK